MRIPARPMMRPTRCGQRRRGLIRTGGVRAHAAVVLVVPNAAPTIASSVMSGPVSSATSRPAAHDQHAMGESEDLLDLVRDEQDRHAVGGQAHEDVVDVALRSDVDAAGRLVGDQDARIDEQRAREEQLLLVAAGQRPAGASRSGDPATRSRAVADLGPLGAAPDEPEPLEAPQARQADVLPDRPAQDQAVVLARLGDERDARIDRGGRSSRKRGARHGDSTTPSPGLPRRSPGRAPSGRRRRARPDRRSRRPGGTASRPARQAPTGPRSRGRPARLRAAAACRDRRARPAGRASR